MIKKYFIYNVVYNGNYSNKLYELVRIYLIFILTFIVINTIITLIKSDYLKGATKIIIKYMSELILEQ